MKLPSIFLIAISFAVAARGQEKAVVVAGAQQKTSLIDSCYASVRATELTRVPILLEASADFISLPYLPSANGFAQSVGMRMRKMLGSNGPTLPEADSVIIWSRMWGYMNVTAHRDKPLSWSVPGWAAGSDTVPQSSLAFLRRAIASVVAEGDGIPITETFSGDSLSFRISLVHPQIERGGRVVPLTFREAIPAFSLPLPWEKPVEMIGRPIIEYPAAAKGQPMMNSVKLGFVVNESGRAVVESVKEVWPANRPLPTGAQLFAYQALVRAVKRGLSTARFSPALVGGCPVNQVVEQTFQFKLPVEQ